MGTLVTYLLVCGLAASFGGPQGAIVAFVVLTVLTMIADFSHRSELAHVSPDDRVAHREDGASHLYYHGDDGTLQHESEGCSDCMLLRADELREQGYEIQEVILGRHRSGELS